MANPTRRQSDPDFLAGPPSPLTQRLVREGLEPSARRAALTERQVLIERLETAAMAGGATPSQRRKIMREAAAFLRAEATPETERAA